jgi:hypothetical protein
MMYFIADSIFVMVIHLRSLPELRMNEQSHAYTSLVRVGEP